MRILHWIPAIIVRCTVFVSYYAFYGYVTSPMGHAHDFSTLMAPISVLFETFSSTAYDYDNFFRVLAPGWSFWILYIFIHKHTPQSWARPPQRSVWAKFAPFLFAWPFVFGGLIYISQKIYPFGKYEMWFISPILPLMFISDLFQEKGTGDIEELKEYLNVLIPGALFFWSVIFCLFIWVKKKLRKENSKQFSKKQL